MKRPAHSNPLHLLIALASGGLLTLMVQLNGAMAAHTGGIFASLTAHATGTFAALLFLALLPRAAPVAGVSPRRKAPLWAYLGGISGAATVILTSVAVNSPLALSGTLALGLGGQAIFGLVADRFGLFGLPVRIPDRRDLASLLLILAGSGIIIFFGLEQR